MDKIVRQYKRFWSPEKAYLLLGTLFAFVSLTLTAHALVTVSNSGLFGDADVVVDGSGTLNLGTASSTAVVIGSSTTPVAIPGALAVNGVLALGSASTTGQLLFWNASSSFTTLLQASPSLTSNLTFTLPSATGTPGQLLSTDGAGNLYFTNAATSTPSQWTTTSTGISYNGGTVSVGPTLLDPVNGITTVNQTTPIYQNTGAFDAAEFAGSGTVGNLLTYGSLFGKTLAWTTSNASLSRVSPTDPYAGYLLSDTATSSTHYVNHNNGLYALNSGTELTAFVIAKAGTMPRIMLATGGAGDWTATYDLSTMAVISSTGAPANTKITNLGGGWALCQMSFVPNASNSSGYFVIEINNGTTTNYLGTGNGNIILRAASMQTQRVGPMIRTGEIAAAMATGTVSGGILTDSTLPSQIFDYFDRADTSLGSIGTSTSGWAWSPNNYRGVQGGQPAPLAPDTTTGKITNNRWVSAPGDVIYSVGHLNGPVGRMVAEVSWTTGNAGSSPGALAMAINRNELRVVDMLHMVFTRANWRIEVWQDSTITVLASGTWSLLNDGTVYRFDVSVVGNTLAYNFAGVTGKITDARVQWANGGYFFFEHFYSTSSVSDLLRIERMYAGVAQP